MTPHRRGGSSSAAWRSHAGRPTGAAEPGWRGPSSTGGFITGADAIDAIVYALKQTGGSTDPTKLAAVLSKLHNFQTLGGPITFTKLGQSVTGRTYRVIEVNNNLAKVVGEHTTKVIPNIH